MSTLLGVLALVISILYSQGLWVSRAFEVLPWGFFVAFFMSFSLWCASTFMKSSYAALAEAKRPFIRSYPLAFAGLLLLFLPDWPSQDIRAGLLFLLFFAWIDALAYDVRAVRYTISFEGASEALKKKITHAIRSKDLSKTLSAFESVSLLCEKTFSENDFQDLQESSTLMIVSVEEVLSALPQITLPTADQAVESLLDRYFLFQAVVSKKLGVLFSLIKKNPSDLKWSLLIKMLTKMTVLFGSLHENFGTPFFMTMGDIALFLQSNHSDKEMDAYAGCVESIKALIDHASQKKKDAKALVAPLFNRLEFFMKERFRKDRTINAALLMQPFAEVGEFLSQPSFLSLNGREELVSDLKRVLSQFAVLETISERMGETGQTDTSSSYQEDLPFLKKEKNQNKKNDERV